MNIFFIIKHPNPFFTDFRIITFAFKKLESYTQFDSYKHCPFIQNSYGTLVLNVSEYAIIFRHHRMFNSWLFVPNQIQFSQKLWLICNRLNLDKMQFLQNIATICHFLPMLRLPFSDSLHKQTRGSNLSYNATLLYSVSFPCA